MKATWCKHGLDPQEIALKNGDLSLSRKAPAFYGTLKGADFERKVASLGGRWRDFYENFALAARDESQLLAPPADTRRVMAIFEAAWQSAREGQKVHMFLP